VFIHNFVLMNTAVTRAPRLPKRLVPGQRVSGSVGPLVENPDASKKRKVRSRLYGNVVEEAGNKSYKVQFDDGQIRSVPSNTLRIEKASASLPPDEHPRPPPTAQGENHDEEDPDAAEEDDERGNPQQEEERVPEEEGEGAEGAEGQGGEANEGTAPAGGVFVGEVLPMNYH
jgi:hypothetical protein